LAKVPMNLRSIDLNLLVVFEALMTERTVTRAARKVGVSQSAMSHALRRLRATFNDDLIRRTRKGMVPTRRAEELFEPVRAALRQIESAVDTRGRFEPKTSERTFVLRVSEYLVGCFLPRLCSRLHAEAPGLKLLFDYLPARSDPDFANGGDIQLRVFGDGPSGPEWQQKRLLSDRFVVVMRHGHPAADRAMTIKAFLALSHVTVLRRVIGIEQLDPMVERHFVRRRIAMTVPSLAAVLPIVANSDFCAVLPEQWIKLYVDPARLAIRRLPVPITFTVDAIWRTSDDRDAGNRWLRRVVEDEFRQMHAASSLQWSPARGRRPRKLVG
jgi:DNA-binding transcriptional LysR family regulator